MNPVRIAVAGIGGWGRNLARHFGTLHDVQLRYLCDRSQHRLDEFVGRFADTQLTTDYAGVLADPAVDAIVLATSAPVHFPLGLAALQAGKDLYVEKPMTLRVDEAQALIDAARARDRILMVGHLLVYHPAVRALRELAGAGELGRIHQLHAQRLNLGTVRPDENVAWDLALHDLAAILFVLGDEPVEVSARGYAVVPGGIEEVAFLTIAFAGGAVAHLHASWLDPVKTRRLTVIGDRAMAVFDDLADPADRLRVFDKGFAVTSGPGGAAVIATRDGGAARSLPLASADTLRLECSHFADCVRTRRMPLSDGREGLRVIRVLAAADASMKAGGAPVSLRE